MAEIVGRLMRTPRLHGLDGMIAPSVQVEHPSRVINIPTRSLNSGLSAVIFSLANKASLPRLDLPSWLKTYHDLIVKQATKLLTTIPRCLCELPNKIREPMVLVTGGLGYVGSHVCLELLRRGYKVLIIDDLTNSFDDTVESIGLALEASAGHGYSKTTLNRIFHIPIDYGDATALDRMLVAYSRSFRVLGAIHLAASKSVVESLKNPWKYYDNNVVKMERFLKLLGRHRVGNVVFSSSATVYGCLPPEVASKMALREDMVPFMHLRAPTEGIVSLVAGLTPYGISKVLGEALVGDFVAEYPERQAVIFRLFNPVGCDSSGHLKENPKDGQRCGGGVMQMIRKALAEDKVFDVYAAGRESGDGSCVRDFVHVGDISRGIVMGFEKCIREGVGKHGDKCRVYNLASGEGVSVRKLLEEVERESGMIVKTRECERREGDVAVSVGDVQKIRRELGWMPKMGIKEVCRDYCKASGIGKYREA